MTYSGKRNPNYKDGRTLKKYHCIDCKKLLSKNAYLGYKRCHSCNTKYLHQIDKLNTKGINNPQYLDGRKNVIHYCKCGKSISYTNYVSGNKNCRVCANNGKKNPNYVHGKAKEPYSSNFNLELKNKIKNRDNYICKLCSVIEIKHQNKYNKKLSVHHIDYNKKNCKENNLITLCSKCNAKVNFNRDYWYAYFMYIMENK